MPFLAGVTIIIIFVFSSGCLDNLSNGSSGGSSGSPGSPSSGSYTGDTSTVQEDTLTGCPAQNDLQCSGWIDANRCQIQSCTCYDSGLPGDTNAAYYHTSDDAYFRCSGAGQTINCEAAAQAAGQHCA